MSMILYSNLSDYAEINTAAFISVIVHSDKDICSTQCDVPPSWQGHCFSSLDFPLSFFQMENFEQSQKKWKLENVSHKLVDTKTLLLILKNDLNTFV